MNIKENIYVIVTHPDEVYGCVVTISKLSKKKNIYLCVLFYGKNRKNFR